MGSGAAALKHSSNPLLQFISLSRLCFAPILARSNSPQVCFDPPSPPVCLRRSSSSPGFRPRLPAESNRQWRGRASVRRRDRGFLCRRAGTILLRTSMEPSLLVVMYWRCFQVRFDETQPFAAVRLQGRNRHGDRAVHKRRLSARDEMKAHLFHFRLEGEIDGRGVDAAADERRQSFLRAAELQQGHVLRSIETGVFEHDAREPATTCRRGD